MSVAGRCTRDEFGKRAEGERGGGVPLVAVRKEKAEREAGTEVRWKGEVGEWPRWTDGSDGEGEDDGVSTGWRSDEEEVCAACEEALPDTEAAEEDDDSSRPPVAVKVIVKDGARAAVLDSACYSMWVDKKAFWEMGRYEYDDGGSAWSADGSPLRVAGRGRLDFCLWGRLFRRVRVRVMQKLPSKLLIGRQFMIKFQMDLLLGKGQGRFTVETENGPTIFSGSIRYQLQKGGGEQVAEMDDQQVVADTLDAIEEMDLSGFGETEDQEALRSVLREYSDVFSPKTGTVPGWEFRIKVEDGAELARLNRLVMRRSPMEQEEERREMQGLLERGIVEPSESPYGTANVFVPKKALPDGTSGGLRVTADMRAVNSVTVGDAFPGEDIQTIVNWLAGKKWYSVADLRDGYWNAELAKESRPYTAVKTLIGLVQYTRMTMGLKYASAFFQRLVNHVYDGLKGEKLQAYLDDLAVGSDTPKQHVADVREVWKGRGRQTCG
jgi:hypothetical protein